MRQLLTQNLGWKLLSLLLAVVLWLAIAREPEVAASLSVPVEFKNMRDDLDIIGNLPDRVILEVRGPSGRLTRDNLSTVAAVLDLSDAQPGERTYNIRGRNLNLPAGVVFYRAVPSQPPLNLDGRNFAFDPRTLLTEIYNVPAPGFGVRGADIDRNGVVWTSLASGHLGRFDRRQCKGPLNGPTATGDHCPEGWSFFRLPGPGFAELPQFSVESSYYTWVDQHDTLGLGMNVPIATGNLSDGVHALVDGKFVTLRLPYPLGFYMKGMEGRIDDTSAGWKGRGLWVTSGDRTPWHKEGGKGTKPMIVHFQVRPDPLAD